MRNSFTIRPFKPSDQSCIEALVLTIQRDEFGLELTVENQPDLQDIAGFFSQPGSAFWVAEVEGAIVGCIGLEVISGTVAVMRKFMVQREWRGRDLGVAALLHKAFLQHAQAIGASSAILSTVSATKAAQAFYVRAGYQSVSRAAMPEGFVPGVLDVVFMTAKI